MYPFSLHPTSLPFLSLQPSCKDRAHAVWRGKTFNHRQAAAGGNSGGQWLLTCVVGCTGELAFHGNTVNTDLYRWFDVGQVAVFFTSARKYSFEAAMMDRES